MGRVAALIDDLFFFQLKVAENGQAAWHRIQSGQQSGRSVHSCWTPPTKTGDRGSEPRANQPRGNHRTIARNSKKSCAWVAFLSPRADRTRPPQAPRRRLPGSDGRARCSHRILRPYSRPRRISARCPQISRLPFCYEGSLLSSLCFLAASVSHIGATDGGRGPFHGAKRRPGSRLLAEFHGFRASG